MGNNPKFTILIPAKGRPDLVRDALLSVIYQNYTNFEIIISNNGADLDVKNAIADLIKDPRVRYIEHDKVLSMPEHWEKISLLANGEYLTVLTDRSVLKQDALKTLVELHSKSEQHSEIISWPWDLFYTEYKLLVPFNDRSDSVVTLDSDQTLLESMSIGGKFPTALPRGLNSSVSMKVVRKIREIAGSAFLTITPDFSFAYNCLLIQKKFTHICYPLMISQGLSVSNGGNAYLTDASNYVSTLNLIEPITHSPIKGLFVENVIAEDFFAAIKLHNREDLLTCWDISNLYIKCLIEQTEKVKAGLLDDEKLRKLDDSVKTALSKQMLDIQVRVSQTTLSKNSIITTSIAQKLKKIISTKLGFLKPWIIRLKGGKKVKSILEASGHIQK